MLKALGYSVIDYIEEEDSSFTPKLDTFEDLEILSFAQCKKVTWKSASKLGEYFERRKKII